MHQSSPQLETEVAYSSTPNSRPRQSSATVAAAAKTAKSTKSPFSRRTNSLLGVQVLSTGSYVPENVVTNADLQEQRGFDPEWIEQRTGILERRHALAGEATSDLAVKAAEKAIAEADVDPSDIDLLLVGTFSPDYYCPSTACLVQDRLGLDVPAVDLQAACSGFMYSMVTGAQFVATGNSKLALVIGADCNSRIVDQTDRKIAPLFGDGAGAVLLTQGDAHQGLMCYQMGSDGSGGRLLEIPAGGSASPCTDQDLANGRRFLQMDGRNVFKWAVRALTETIELMLDKTGIGVDDVALYVIHQANIRIINYAIEQLGIDPERVYNNLDRYGNTSAGSIPIALDEAARQGRIQPGDTVLMSGFGAGLTWGTSLFRW